jgi:hypothetical protein
MKESCAHVPKKNKGIGGKATIPSAAALMMHCSPQQKSAGQSEWVMINSPLCSQGPPSSSGSLSLSGMEDDSSAESAIATDLSLPRAPAASWFAPASLRGGHRYGYLLAHSFSSRRSRKSSSSDWSMDSERDISSAIGSNFTSFVSRCEPLRRLSVRISP